MSHFGHELLGEATDVSHKGVWLQCDGAPGVAKPLMLMEVHGYLTCAQERHFFTSMVHGCERSASEVAWVLGGFFEVLGQLLVFVDPYG